MDDRVDASGAADEEQSIVFRIQVQQDFAVQESRFEAESARQSGFFVHGEQAFDGTVFQIVRCQDGQFHGHADTVVGAQGGVLGFEPAVFDMDFNRVGIEIVLRIPVLFADHVHVALQDHARTVFVAGRGRFADQDIACLVGLVFQLVFFCEIHQVGPDFVFFLGGSWDLQHFPEIFPEDFRFQCIENFVHCILCLIICRCLVTCLTPP